VGVIVRNNSEVVDRKQWILRGSVVVAVLEELAHETNKNNRAGDRFENLSQAEVQQQG
jgi:hypothetical protein